MHGGAHRANTESIEIWHIWVMLGIRSAMQAFQAPAAAASTYMLVPKVS
ncbi:hypothetical protein J4731_06665 [Providencia rettgeri]|nr:hypothetical protein [Providencia rettgeri]